MTDDPKTVLVLRPDDAEAVVDVLCESFFAYPVMTFILGDEGNYAARLRTLIRFFVMARVLRRELLLGVRGEVRLEGAALVSRPGAEDPPGHVELRESVWAELGNSARLRYDACVTGWAPVGVDRPHIHLNMIGVRGPGRGLGRRLLEFVHSLSADDPRSEGVSLTTESEGNVALYRHLGYRVVGSRRITDTLTTWGFFRPD